MTTFLSTKIPAKELDTSCDGSSKQTIEVHDTRTVKGIGATDLRGNRLITDLVDTSMAAVAAPPRNNTTLSTPPRQPNENGATNFNSDDDSGYTIPAIPLAYGCKKGKGCTTSEVIQ
jgi:hypothetical protein